MLVSMTRVAQADLKVWFVVLLKHLDPGDIRSRMGDQILKKFQKERINYIIMEGGSFLK